MTFKDVFNNKVGFLSTKFHYFNGDYKKKPHISIFLFKINCTHSHFEYTVSEANIDIWNYVH